MNDPRPKSRLPSLLTILGIAGLALFLALYFRPAPVLGAPALLVGDEGVRVETSESCLSFAPAQGSRDGFLFYPGARVPPEAYAYLG